jgi:uncharacterized protein (TIGR03085 family)
VAGWAEHERAALCDALVELGPDAATLCEGWQTEQLAAHCYVRERRPDAALGVLPLGPLSAYTERVMASTLRALGYDEIVSRLRKIPPHLRIGPVDAAINTVEYFVHTEDVRRPNALPARDLPADFERTLWRRLSKQARLSFRRVDAELTLVPTVGDPVRVGKGERLEVRGRPSELMLLAFNRKDAAKVDLIGSTSAVEKLQHATLGI